MTHNDWEHGELVLPSAAVAPLKKHLRETINGFRAEVLAEAKRIRRGIGTRSPEKYHREVQAKQLSIAASRGRSAGDRSKRVHLAALDLLESTSTHHWQEKRAPRQVTSEDMTREGFPVLTNRSTVYPVVGGLSGLLVDGDAFLSITGRTVLWEVQENNRAVEDARDTLAARALFGYLDGIRWTRSTGGYGVGNDEYHQDDREAGGGGNYVTFRYGPLGIAASA